MEFLVEFDITVPADASAADVNRLSRKERTRIAELASRGHVLRLWKPPQRPDEWRTLGLYSARDEEELRAVVGTLPLLPWMQLNVTPLLPHLNDPAQATPDERDNDGRCEA